LLPAGAVAGRGLHPLDKRRLVTAYVDCGHFETILTAHARLSPRSEVADHVILGRNRTIEGSCR